ncbi:MAG TPA: c-type cytochrome [Vicinamibacterales bacterium]|nr:c-type cytochrome [Vicinamibacterales bacterium]
MTRLSCLVLTTLVISASTAGAQQPPAGGQRAGGPPPMTNLQILPKDSSREQVLTTMAAFTAALGVQCNYCHVQEGRGGRNDMAADEKPTKKAARAMMLLARDINTKLPEALGKSADATTRVGCATCHRGIPIPKQITDIMTEAAAGGGATAGIAKFKELREKFYPGQSYDFGETTMLTMSQRANTAGKADDALAYLQANVEYWPKSVRTYSAMAQLKTAKGDKAGAIAAIEKVLEIDPNNAQAKAQLENLKK